MTQNPLFLGHLVPPSVNEAYPWPLSHPTPDLMVRHTGPVSAPGREPSSCKFPAACSPPPHPRSGGGRPLGHCVTPHVGQLTLDPWFKLDRSSAGVRKPRLYICPVCPVLVASLPGQGPLSRLVTDKERRPHLVARRALLLQRVLLPSPSLRSPPRSPLCIQPHRSCHS